MNMTFTVCMILLMFLMMAMLPLLVFVGLGSALGAKSDEVRVLVAFFLLAGVVVFLASLGVFTLMQKEDCKKVDMTKALNNSGLALLIQIASLVLVWLVAPLRNVIKNLLPPDTDQNITDGLAYGYYAGFAGMYSTLIGASFSGMCD
jgi:uncharacterized membrane protein